MNPVNHETNSNCILLTDYFFCIQLVINAEYDYHTYLHKLHNACYYLVASVWESMGVLREFA